MYLLARRNNEEESNARLELYSVLSTIPCKPFDSEPESESQSKDINDAEKEAGDNHNDDVYQECVQISPHAYSIDALLKYHAKNYMDAYSNISPVYKDYARWGGSICRATSDLREHIAACKVGEQNIITPSSDPFKELQIQNNKDLNIKRTRQLQTEIKQLKELQKRFIDDLSQRKAILSKWENSVICAWEKVLPQIYTFGVPVSKHVLVTMHWLYDKNLLTANYHQYIDIGHYVLTRVLPYTHVLIAMATVYHSRQLINLTLDNTFTLVESQDITTCNTTVSLWRYLFILGGLYRCYPYLRDWQLSKWHLRTDIIVWSSAVWTITGDTLTAILWWLGLELYTHRTVDIL